VLGGTGLAVGVLTGLVGVGGGFLIVPALVLLAGVPIRRAVGASLVVISLSTLTGLAAHHRQATISWDVVALFTMLAIVGTVGGTRAARHVAPEALRRAFGVLVLVLAALILFQNRAAAAQQNPPGTVLLVPARVFDGIAARPHEGWGVLIRGDRIEAAGPRGQLRAPADAVTIELPGATLLPGLIDAHSHLLLHPYDEASWDDQVLREPLALRVARATNHARATLMAGFTTVRDLGAEGAGYADVGLKQAIDQGIIPGPRVLATTKAIVATGSYGPKGFDPDFRVPQGAEEADGIDGLTRVVRDQIGNVPTGSKYTPTTAGGRRAEPRTFSEQSAKRARASGHAL
jgi:hypothetical protein